MNTTCFKINNKYYIPKGNSVPHYNLLMRINNKLNSHYEMGDECVPGWIFQTKEGLQFENGFTWTRLDNINKSDIVEVPLINEDGQMEKWIKSFSESLDKSPFEFINKLLSLMGKDILTQQSIANELTGINKKSWELVKKIDKSEVPTPVSPLYDRLNLGELKTVPTSNICWNTIIRYNDNYLVLESGSGILVYKKVVASNFSERLMKCFSFDSYMTLYPEFVTKLLAKGPKVAEITTKETDIDLGNGFGWNLEKGTLIIHVNGSNYYFGPRYKKSDSEVKRVKNLDGSTDVLNVPKSGAKPYEYFGFLSAYDGNPYRKLTEFFRSLNLGFWGGSSADDDLYRDYQEANGDKSKFINLWDPKYRKSAELRWEELSKLGWIQTYDH